MQKHNLFRLTTDAKPLSTLRSHGQGEGYLDHLQSIGGILDVRALCGMKEAGGSQSLQSHQLEGQINASKIPFHFVNGDFLS